MALCPTSSKAPSEGKGFWPILSEWMAKYGAVLDGFRFALLSAGGSLASGLTWSGHESVLGR
jgi:hypothetical protein